MNKRILIIFMVVLACVACMAGNAFSGESRGSAGEGGRGDAPGRDAAGHSGITIGRVKYGGGGDWYCDSSSLPNLLREFEHRTGIPAADSEKRLEIGDPELSGCPFLYISGHGNIQFTGKELGRLRRYLLNGGFLYADDNYGMDESFRRVVEELFPERELVPVPLDHIIYKCFYQLKGPPKIHEHDGEPPQGLGVFNGDKLMIFYTYQSDIGDGLEDEDVHGDPPEKREQAIRMAVNILFYALTR